MPDIPAPSIYLRNRFSVRGSHCNQLLAGKELLLRSTQEHWKLLAGCGNRGLKLGQNLPEPALHLMLTATHRKKVEVLRRVVEVGA